MISTRSWRKSDGGILNVGMNLSRKAPLGRVEFNLLSKQSFKDVAKVLMTERYILKDHQKILT